MIGQWIPEQNEHWLSYLLLLDIVDILLAPSIAVEDTALLSAMIQDHHYDLLPFIRVFSDSEDAFHDPYGPFNPMVTLKLKID